MLPRASYTISPNTTNQFIQSPISIVSEPMNLGSPSNTSPHNSQFLPSFLFGDGNQSGTSRITQATPAASYSRPMQLTSPQTSPTGPNLSQHRRSTGRDCKVDLVAKRCTSPPTKSLWSTTNPLQQQSRPTTLQQPSSQHLTSPFSIRHSTPSASTEAGHVPFNQFRSPQPIDRRLTPARPSVGIMSPGNLNQSANMLTPDRLVNALNSHSNAGSSTPAEDCWVTVFGFPTSKASYILNQFSQLGTIEKHLITNNGNWMHIRYQNKLQARCALGRNGRVFGDNIMVGVMACSDQDVINDRVVGAQANEFDADQENSYHAFHSPAPARLGPPSAANATPLKDHLSFRSNVHDANRSLMTASFTATMEKRPQTGVARHNSMRSLAGDYRPGSLNRTASVRQGRDPGLLSKALGYMFGWS